MKKFFILICGILCVTNAFGVTKRTLNTPIKITDDKVINAWDMKDVSENLIQGIQDFFDKKDTKYSKIYTDWVNGDVKGIFAPMWQFNTTAGTYGTSGNNLEGSITPIIAREIYEHGGKFCMTQMQAGWGTNSGRFIDYFTDNKYQCATICEPGYHGTYCEKVGYECPQNGSAINYKTALNNREDNNFRLTSGEQENRIRPQVFDFKNAGNVDASSGVNSRVVVLGLLDIKEHAVIASPVLVVANNNKIIGAYSAEAYRKPLCAPGYTPNALGNDCVPAPQCGDNTRSFCSGETGDGFDETQHIWIIDDVKNCKKFRCRDDKGFTSENNKNCIECPGAPLAYVNDDGICDMCDRGQNPNNNCKNNMTSYDKSHMQTYGNKQCWLETIPKRFAGCIHGCSQSSGGGECWDWTRKTCISCN